MAGGRLDFEFNFGPSGPGASEGQPARILVLADLAGDGLRPRALSGRLPLTVDIDNVGQVMARIAPRLRLQRDDPGGGGAAVELAFADIDDLHPDALFRRSPAFAGQRRLREELLDAASFPRAAAALGLDVGAGAGTGESDVETLSRLLGRAPEVPAAGGQAGLVDRLVREAVAPHVVADDGTVRRRAVADFDLRIAEDMRRILRQPAFRRLETAWRGVWRLAGELECGDDLTVSVLDLSRAELQGDLLGQGAALARLLTGPEVEEAGPWSLLVADFEFADAPDDLAMLTALAGLGAAARVPVLAGAAPSLVGSADAVGLADPAQWQVPGQAAAWRALRENAAAPWLGLVTPRLLVRLPYGAVTDPVESFAFDELADGRGQDHYLWGSPVYALAVLIGRAWVEGGPLGQLLESLPSHVYRDADGESRQQPCAETWLSEAAAEAVLERGIMPLLSYRNRDAARLLRWQSVASPASALAGLPGD